MFIRNLALLFILSTAIEAQVMIPEPGPSRPVAIPPITQTKLANGLTVRVVRKTGSPLITTRLVVANGAGVESRQKAGLASLTATMLTKGTKRRTATEIAESVEFLGGSIASGAGWNGSFAAITVTSDKLSQALAIFADVALNPKFAKDELDLLRTQTLDGLTYNLKQPSFLAGFVASRYSFDEHPAGGTKASISSINVPDIAGFYQQNYRPDSSILIFTGDIDAGLANSLAKRHFGRWRSPRSDAIGKGVGTSIGKGQVPLYRRIMVVDLPRSGQAAVMYAKRLYPIQRATPSFFTASVFNSIFGGGYSSRLNTEIRIKRGLSYGAGSSFAWRRSSTNFAATIQTKNESAAEVADLVLAELKRMVDTDTGESELVPRKAVIIGGFGRNFETGSQLAAALGDLFVYALPTSDLNSFIGDVNRVTAEQVREFATGNMRGGDLIIVGDYSVFKDDLAKRFSTARIDVVAADSLTLSGAEFK